MKPRSFVLAGLIIAAIVVLGIVTWCWLRPAREGIVAETAPVQKRRTPEGAGAHENSAGPASRSDMPDSGILLRLAKESGDLLVKFPGPGEVYRYEKDTRKITPAPEREWLAGEDEISCRQQHYRLNRYLYVDDEKGVLQIQKDGSRVATAGAVALKVSESPGGGPAAVLSAPGPRTSPQPALWGFGGQGTRTKGQRYVQILDIAGGSYITRPLGLEAVREFPDYRFCWPDNEKAVVVYEVVFDNNKELEIAFHVIETGK